MSGKPVVLKEGRFGPYVTDGETNASLRAGDTVDAITPERAYDLIQERRDRGPDEEAHEAEVVTEPQHPSSTFPPENRP